MPITVTPTLSSSSGYLLDVRDQVANLIRFVIMNPGGTSDLWEDYLVSFRTMASKYEHNRNQLCDNLKSSIENVLRRKFSDYTFTLDFTTEDYEANTDRYTIHFGVTISTDTQQTVPVLMSGRILVDKLTNEINLVYDRSVDTAMLNGDNYD